MQPTRPRNRRLAVSLFCALLLVSGLALGCSSCGAIHNSSATGTPILRTALQRTIVANAVLSESNLEAERIVSQLLVSQVINPSQARPVMLAFDRVAAASDAVLAITSKGTEASWSVDGPKIRAVITAVSPNTIPKIGVTNQTLDLAISAVQAAITLVTAQVGAVQP